ncbi:MAG: nucleotidyltransferase family protein [Candidatus Wallbacteria bacterium]|nr:nucleotidyltransferase family protein [Candidatus Wallbacteria bacterium]
MGIAEIHKKRKEILEIARKHGVGKIKLFGSFARGEATEKSDIDFLIEIQGPTTPWFPGGLVYDLQELLGHPVDVVEAAAIKLSLRDHVFSEAIDI